ncbi:phage tail protein [Shimia sp. Alg240-R146]|uniref:phage tail protein n=1 Tax=Shimia sp. Alg240-R146 TaxID=2993449 RepID=UPI0022E7C042|nr:tail fiber protein [Shimia sp. Alg240-R146]
MKKITKTLAVALCTFGAGTTQSVADTDPFIGTIMQVGENFCPRGWASANGAILAISQHTALFSLLGTTYGGDGRTTFALPDLRGRYNMHVGTGPGLSPNRQGEVIGLTDTTYTITNLPSHSHAVGGTMTASVAASSNAPNTASPANSYKPTFPAGAAIYATTTTPNVTMGAGSVNFTHNVTLGNNGNQQPLTNMQPYTAINTCIALEGTYPSRP